MVESIGGGVSPQKMDPRFKSFLKVLKDGRWHQKFPTSQIPVYVPLVCLKLKLVEEKTKKIRGSRSLRVRFRITLRGKMALAEGIVPSKNDVRVAQLVSKGGVDILQGSDRETWPNLIAILNTYDLGYTSGYLGS